ncbi:MAG: hypothetical protein KJ757_05380 [Planctomycetes bacterium]|nr:hypothetical protein [Planctomycetota bacterium]
MWGYLVVSIMYETKRNSKRTSATQAASDSSAERWRWNPRGCPNSWLFRQFGGSMARWSHLLSVIKWSKATAQKARIEDIEITSPAPIKHSRSSIFYIY